MRSKFYKTLSSLFKPALERWDWSLAIIIMSNILPNEKCVHIVSKYLICNVKWLPWIFFVDAFSFERNRTSSKCLNSARGNVVRKLRLQTSINETESWFLISNEHKITLVAKMKSPSAAIKKEPLKPSVKSTC